MISSTGIVKLHSRWGFLHCDYNLGKYLRRLYYNYFYKCRKLERPSNNEHITIVSPWDDVSLINLHRWNNIKLNFSIHMKPNDNGNALWLPVVSEDIEEFRENVLGVQKNPGIPLHFCVGYLTKG